MNSTSTPTRTCPQCNTEIEILPGYHTWCERCEWNLELPEKPAPKGLFEKLHLSLARRYSERLFHEMMTTWRPGKHLSFSSLLAYGLAGLVHSLSLALTLLGIWLAFVALPHTRGFGILLGALCWVLAGLMLPGPPQVKGFPLSEQQYPALHHLVSQVAGALGCPPPSTILYDLHYNAGFGKFGWRQQPTLILGLPLLQVLEGQEIVALLSHELAHAKSGDPGRNLFLRATMISLSNWYELIHPRNRWHVRAGVVSPILLVINLASLPVAYVLWLVGYILSRLIWIESQRSEYRADGLAAQVSGTQAQLSLLAKAQLWEAFENHLRFAYIRHQDQDFFLSLKHFIECAPQREYERLRRIEAALQVSYNLTHPTAAYRAEFLKAHFSSNPKVTLSYFEIDRLEQELRPLAEQVQKQIMALDEINLRHLFGPII